MLMKRIVFIVEGDTELCFIEKRIIPYLYSKGCSIAMNAQKITTNRRLNKSGGNVCFDYLQNEIKNTAAQGNVLITTFVDFFRLPNDFPSYTADSTKIVEIEKGMRQALEPIIGPMFFLPYIQRHEIEALMYVKIDGFEIVIDDENQLESIRKILAEYPYPEDINGGPDTAPSKRLLEIYPQYKKTFDAELIFEVLDIDEIRSKCPRFHEWLGKLEYAIKVGHF